MIDLTKFFRFWLIGVVVSFTTVLYVFVVNGAMNAIMLAFLFTSPLLLILRYNHFQISEVPAYALILCLLFLPLYHLQTYRISTILYSFLFIVSFITFRRILQEGLLLRSEYLAIIQLIVYAYMGVLVIQQFSVLAHIPVFNQCWQFPNPFKLNSLALEPSHIGRILLLLSFSFVKVRSKELGIDYKFGNNFQNDRWFWISIGYVMLTCGSTNCLFCFLLLVLYFQRKSFLSYFPVLILATLFLFVLLDTDWLMQNEAVQRLLKIIPATLSFDVPTIISTDLSAAARIAPPLQYIQNINISDVNFWIGNGVDYSNRTIVNFLLSRDDIEFSNAAGGLFPSFFLDFGFISGILFFVMLKKMALSKLFSFETLIWITCFFAAGFNTYTQWCFFIIMTATHYFCEDKGFIA